MNRVVMLGSGGHARVIRETLLEQGIEVHGFIAPSESHSRLGDTVWLGDDDALRRLDTTVVSLVNGIGLAKASLLRAEVFLAAKALGFSFLSVVDATATVKSSAALGEGSQILAGAIVGSGATIGADAIINSGAIVDHDSNIGAHSHIATGAALAGSVAVGEASHIGLGARVIQGVTVGSNCTVGAGAVVLENVADGNTAVGIPATSRPKR